MTTTTTTMAARQSDWQPGHVPKLSYRNPLPADEQPASPTDEVNGSISPRAGPTPGASIRDIRANLPRRPSVTSHRLSVAPPAQKKKSSLLGGLFVKEPSMAALDQVAAQMMQQHGALVPKTVPHVSSQRMPEHVPKVNSKWDGVPDAVKNKEKQLRDRQKAANRNSLLPTITFSSQGTDVSDQNPSGRRSSNAESWDSRSTGSRPTFQDNPSMRPASVYSSDSGSSDEPRFSSTKLQLSQIAPDSGSSESSAFSPIATKNSTKVPERHLDPMSSTAPSPSDRPVRPKSMISTVPTEAIPEYSSSPVSTPPELSPQTPLLSESIGLNSRKGPSDEDLVAVYKSKRSSMQPMDAFLAGEAKPLELSSDESEQGISDLPFRTKNPRQFSKTSSITNVKQDPQRRPDSSRLRLGLNASMVVRTDAAPWEYQSPEMLKSPASPMSPRSKFRILRKDRS